jgi:hypothetical protein
MVQIVRPSHTISTTNTLGLAQCANNSLILDHVGDVSAWVANSRLLAPSVFHPAHSWNGQSRFEIYSASFDSGQICKFAKNGTFVVSFDDNKNRESGLNAFTNTRISFRPNLQAPALFFHAGSVFQSGCGSYLPTPARNGQKVDSIWRFFLAPGYKETLIPITFNAPQAQH